MPEDKNQSKMIPERDLIVLKKGMQREIDELKKDLASHQETNTNLSKRVAELESGGNVDVAETRRKLFTDQQSHATREKELAKREEKLREHEHQVQANSLAATYGVDVEDLLSCKDMTEMKVVALEKSNAKLQEANKSTPTKSSPGGYEHSTPAAVNKSVLDMPKVDFEKHVDQLRKEALSRK